MSSCMPASAVVAEIKALAPRRALISRTRN
jgi:hypothetical protein